MADGELPPPYAVRDPVEDEAAPPQSPPAFEEVGQSSRASTAATIGQAVQSAILSLENLERGAPSSSGEAYFNIRPPRNGKTSPVLVHAITIKPSATPEHLKHPGQRFRDRDVNEYDWMTFLNYCFMEDTMRSIGEQGPVVMEKGRIVNLSTPKSSTMERFTPKNAVEDAERRTKLVAVIDHWNQGFFEPRGIRIRGTILRTPNLVKDAAFDLDSKPAGGETALYKAVRMGDVETARLLLSKGADPNINAPGNSPMLYKACSKACDDPGFFWTSRGTKEHREILYLLLAHGADVDAKKSGEGPAMYLAAKRKEAKLVALLINWGADVERRPASGRSALVEAAEHGDVDMIQTLILAGADVNVVSAGRPTALQAAAWRGDREVVELLVKHNASVAGNHIVAFGTPVQAAVERGDIRLLRILLSHGADPNDCSHGAEMPLSTAINSKRMDLMRTLLEWGADPAKQKWGKESALATAVGRGQLDLVREMLKGRGENEDPERHRELVAQAQRAATETGKLTKELLG